MNTEQHYKKAHNCNDEEHFSTTTTPVGTGQQTLTDSNTSGQIPTGTGDGYNADPAGVNSGYENAGPGYNNNAGTGYNNNNAGPGYDNNNAGPGYNNAAGTGYNNNNAGPGYNTAGPGYENTGSDTTYNNAAPTSNAYNNSGYGGSGYAGNTGTGVGGNSGTAGLSTGQKIASAIPGTQANKEKKAFQNQY